LSEVLHGRDLQRQTLRLYGELLVRSGNLASKLVFSSGAGASASGLSAAVSILGGTSLIVDPDAATVKSVLRQGGVDFVVNTLDEAVRVLKNEIRKHTPLSVALVADVDASLQEMSERGVVADVEVQVGGAEEVLVNSTALLRLRQRDGIVGLSDVLSRWLDEHGWIEQHMEVASIAALRTLDVRLIGMLSADDSARMQWLRRIPQYQRPSADTGRMLWLSADEAAMVSTAA
jgi:hypothetical protein